MKDNKNTILLVDDNPDNIELLVEILRAQGYDTLTAQTGRDAIHIAAESNPDLILLDIAMPVMDGFEVFRVLKADKSTASIPVIFVTGVMESEKVLDAIADDGVDYVPKPFVISDVLEKIERHISDTSKKI